MSTNNESLLIVNVSTRCGLRPNARQIRDTADWVILVCAANDRVDQCVAFAGLVSSVVTTTCSTWSSVIVRGRPVLEPPSTHASTIRARIAKPCAVVRRRDQPSRTRGSSSDRIN